jgi:uncharacterized protein (TIGR02265 family)
MMDPMPADRTDLAARLAAASPGDTVRGLIFEGVFDLLREHGGEEDVLACDPSGKGRRADFLSYPVADYLRLAWAAADRLEAVLGGVDAAFFRMGYRATANVLGSTLGHTLLTFGRNPRTLLSQASSAYRATVSYGQRTVTWQGDRHARLEFVRDFLVVPFHRGVLEAVLDGTGAKGGRVEGRVTGFLQAVYEVSWE